ncbi:hypothetical protein FGG78_34815 [Thioclava sp. BHET1]|nr:hypothetical protein FGG78_34815 [Thioclava sp. BHET1]
MSHIRSFAAFGLAALALAAAWGLGLLLIGGAVLIGSAFYLAMRISDPRIDLRAEVINPMRRRPGSDARLPRQ